MKAADENALLTAEDLSKGRILPPLAQVLDLMSDIAPEGCYGTRAEWIDLFIRTKATNVPAILFADAVKLGLFIEELPEQFYFVKPEQPIRETGIKQPVFSYFEAPIVQPKGVTAIPDKNVTLLEAWQMIVGSDHQWVTDRGRKLYEEYQLTGDKKAYGNHKRYKCDYFSFCATLHTKEDTGIDQYSGLLALDFDKLSAEDRRRMRNALLEDPFFETALMYNTIGGIRWVIERHAHPTAEQFKSIQSYCLKTYGVKPDDTPDISRASFIFQDKTAYLNPKYAN